MLSETALASPVSTNRLAVAGSVKSFAGMTAASFVPLTNLVARGVFTPLAVHIAHVFTGKPSIKFVPVRVRVRSDDPAVTRAGEMERIEGTIAETSLPSLVSSPPSAACRELGPQPQTNPRAMTMVMSLIGHLPAVLGSSRGANMGSGVGPVKM